MTQAMGSRKDGRVSVGYALVTSLLWLGGMATYALTAPSLTSEFRSHLTSGLVMFCFIIVGPLLLTILTLNWIVRRIAGGIITLLFFGMVRGGFSQGFGLAADAGIVLVAALLVGLMLFFLSRPPVMSATGDFYNFLGIRDVLSTYTFRRKPSGT